MLLRKLILGFIILSGFSAVLVCGYWVWADWTALDKAYWEYRRQVKAGAGMRDLFIANSFQDMHRINCFADGVGFMLGALIASVGFVGWFNQFPLRESKTQTLT